MSQGSPASFLKTLSFQHELTTSLYPKMRQRIRLEPQPVRLQQCKPQKRSPGLQQGNNSLPPRPQQDSAQPRQAEQSLTGSWLCHRGSPSAFDFSLSLAPHDPSGPHGIPNGGMRAAAGLENKSRASRVHFRLS